MTEEPADAGQEAVEPAKDRPRFQLRSDIEVYGSQLGMVELLSVFAAGNFCSAFFQALGKRAADGAVKLPKHATDLVRKRVGREGKPDQYYIGLDGDATAVIVVTGDTPDEARLALLDLDVTAPDVRGKELVWDGAVGAWRPSDALPPELDGAAPAD